MNKVLIVGVVIVILIGGVWFWKMHKQNPTPVTQTSYVAPASSSIPKSTLRPATPAAVVTDKSLDQSFQNVQAGLNKLDTDQKAANTDSSSQDTPGNY